MQTIFLTKMLSSLRSFVNEHVIFEPRKTNYKVLVYRDELDIKSPSESDPKKKESFETKPLVQKLAGGEKNFDVKKNSNFGADNENKAARRVKILMTKGEATRLLSKCKEAGGVLEFNDLVHSELDRIPTSRVSLVSSVSNKSSARLLKKTFVDKED